jgi:hypothetical protein
MPRDRDVHCRERVHAPSLDRIGMSSRIARPAYGSRQGSGGTREARVDMAWYAVGLIAHKPEQLADLGDRVVKAAQGGDAWCLTCCSCC